MGATYNTTKSGSTSKTTSASKGGSTSKTYASGKVSDKTQKNKNKYSGEYKQSNAVNQAYQNLQGLNKPGVFNSQYETQMNELYDKFVNRGDFQFDVNESALYEQLKDRYSALGKLAMQDTMGQAAGMTGGYGNSYAQTAGQQTYQEYMQQLQEQIPSLYQMELDRYNQEGENMLNQYNLAKNLYDTEYGEHRDAMSDYYTDRDYYNALYQNERDFDYGKYTANRDYWTNQYWNERNAATTTESSDWSTNTSTTENTSWTQEPKEGTVASAVPLSEKGIAEIMLAARNTGSKKAAEKYITDLYASKNITEEQMNYFLDVIEDDKEKNYTDHRIYK